MHGAQKRWLITGMAAAVAALALGGWLGWRAAGANPSGVVPAASAHAPALAGLREELESLRREAEMLRTRHAVDRRALELLRLDLAGMQEREAELEDAVRFYRSLMAPQDVGQGLSVRDPELVALDAPGRFAFRLVVQQHARKHQRVEGELAVEIHGVIGDEVVNYPLAALSAAPSPEALPLQFRYFQSVEGELQLPQGLEPKSIVVVARATRPATLEIRREFPWHLQERLTHVGR